MEDTLYPAETNSDTVTSFIPLTTVWPLSSGCESYFRLNGPSLVAYDPGYGLDINSKVICAPPAVTTWWEQGLLGKGGRDHTVVSIGPMTCPDGFVTVASSTKDGSSTLAMCCPPGYYLANGQQGRVIGDCLSTIRSGAVLTYASTPKFDPNGWTTVTTTLSTLSTVGAIAVQGWNIKRTPAPSTSTPLSSPLFTFGTSSVASSTNWAATPSQTQMPQPDNGLSTAAKAGIGAGVGLGAIGVIALLVALCLFRRRKRPETTVEGATEAIPPMYLPVSELATGFGSIAELPARPESKSRPAVPVPPAELGDFR